MKKVIKSFWAVGLLSLFTVVGTANTHAASLDVMTIGDSLTAGNPTTGTWIEHLQTNLNNAPGAVDNFSFVGTQSTTFNSVTVQHEGYGGWYIETSNNVNAGTNNREGIRDNLTSNGGVIAPQNADIAMLALGINDVIGLTDGGTSHNDVSDLIIDLGELIDEIVALAPNTTLFVSTLLPVSENGLFGVIDGTYDGVNDDVDEFNSQLVNAFFDNTWFDDGSELDAYASHTLHENVILLNANNAIDNGLGAGDIVSDGVHLTVQGNEALGDWYADRFATLVPEPASAAVLAVLGCLAMCRRRRSA
ncbi:MAG: SGNH/GDSL hydrolase family protein [Phycisphaeraceae bacterium]|nr:SGNH/GDSL hydrolase family protein [Phycisphaeraceae bacterium]